MFSSTIFTLLLASLTVSSAVPLESRAVTAPTYYLANCYPYPYTTAYGEYAAIGYYAHLETLPSTPSKISILNSEDTLDYEDGTWFATSPFVLTVVIFEDAYTASEGTVVGNATTGQKDYDCYRMDRAQIWVPTDLGVNGTCTADYLCY